MLWHLPSRGQTLYENHERKGIMSKRIFHIIITLAISVSFISITFSCSLAASTQTAALPAVIGVVSSEVGGVAFACATIMAPFMEKEFGRAVRVLPTTSDLARLGMIERGEGQITWHGDLTGTLAISGLAEFADAKIGPLPSRVVWQASPSGFVLAVGKGSPINKISDLKGKRVISIPSRITSDNMVLAFLAHAGLTRNDVITVPTSSWTDNMQALIDGRADVCLTDASTAKMREAQASPVGVKFLPMPCADNEGWKRLRRYRPDIACGIDRRKGILEEVKGIELGVTPYGMHSLASVEEEIVYRMVKVMAENVNKFKDAHSSLPGIAIEEASRHLEFFNPVIYHEGSVRYLKEKGYWKPAHQSWQDTLLAWERDVFAAWKKATAEAKNQGIAVSSTNNKWLNLWDKMRPTMPEK